LDVTGTSPRQLEAGLRNLNATTATPTASAGGTSKALGSPRTLQNENAHLEQSLNTAADRIQQIQSRTAAHELEHASAIDALRAQIGKLEHALAVQPPPTAAAARAQRQYELQQQQQRRSHLSDGDASDGGSSAVLDIDDRELYVPITTATTTATRSASKSSSRPPLRSALKTSYARASPSRAAAAGATASQSQRYTTSPEHERSQQHLRAMKNMYSEFSSKVAQRLEHMWKSKAEDTDPATTDDESAASSADDRHSRRSAAGTSGGRSDDDVYNH
jgi:hypothetical protein